MGGQGNPITQHRYLYAGNDPVNFADPSGLMSMPSQMAAFSIATALANVGSTLIANYQIGSHFAKGRSRPDAFYLHGGYGYQGRGIYGGGALAVVIGLNDNNHGMAVFGGFELAFSPLTMGRPRLRGGGHVLGFGVLFNSESLSDFGGPDIVANWPVAMGNYALPMGSNIGNLAKWKAFNETLYQKMISRSMRVRRAFGTVQLGWSMDDSSATVGYAVRANDFSAGFNYMHQLTPNGMTLEDLFRIPGLDDFIAEAKNDAKNT